MYEEDNFIPALVAFSNYLLYYLTNEKFSNLDDFIAGYLFKTNYIQEATENYHKYCGKNKKEKITKCKKVLEFLKEIENIELVWFERGYWFFNDCIHNNKNSLSTVFFDKFSNISNRLDDYTKIFND